MTPDVGSTAVYRFLDGEYVVPRWWSRLKGFHWGPEHGDEMPVIPMTLEEARHMVNRELERGYIAMAMREWMAGR